MGNKHCQRIKRSIPCPALKILSKFARAAYLSAGWRLGLFPAALLAAVAVVLL